MTVAAMTTAIVTSYRARQAAGEPLTALAKEAGVPWQRLWGLLKEPTMARTAGNRIATARPKTRGGRRAVANGSAGSLPDRYRPMTLAALWGQDGVVKFLKQFAANPYPTAMIFEGATGTGKTSAAFALAAALGCDVKNEEFGGVYNIASGEQTADAVRAICHQAACFPMFGSGWKVIIVNEADRMGSPAETIWLDRLENVSKRTVYIFTTNSLGRLSQRFVDRCAHLKFESSAKKLRASAVAFASAVWREETGHEAPAEQIAAVVDGAVVEESLFHTLSFRRVLQALAKAIVEAR